MSENTVTQNKPLSEKEAKKLARREAKKVAFENLYKVLEEGNVEGAIAELKVIKPSLYGLRQRTSGGGTHVKFVTMLKENGKVTELDAFNEFKAGRKECHAFIRRAVKKAKTPADRVWIAFDKEAGIYTIAGTGENPPKGWNGYQPTETTELK